jgi:hypothetical protein
MHVPQGFLHENDVVPGMIRFGSEQIEWIQAARS